MAVTLDQIKELREATGISTMQCKKALEASGGDVDAAIEALRKKGEVKSAERADRDTSEGVIAISKGDGKAAMIKLACETDFVARNPEFVAVAQEFADRALTEGEGIDLTDEMGELNIKMGERVQFAGVKVVESPVVDGYVHSNKKIGVLIGLSGGTEEQARNVGMQVAAMNPVALDKDGVDAATVEKEIEIGKEQARQEGKPEAILEKIAQGKLQKFFKENTLLSQAFVKEPKQSVAQYVDSVNRGMTVAAAKRVAIG